MSHLLRAAPIDSPQILQSLRAVLIRHAEQSLNNFKNTSRGQQKDREDGTVLVCRLKVVCESLFGTAGPDAVTTG